MDQFVFLTPERSRGAEHGAEGSSDHGKVFVGGLSWDTTEETIRAFFNRYHSVKSVHIMRDKATGTPRGFGFLQFDESISDSVLERVCSERHFIDDRHVEIKRAQPKGAVEGAARGGGRYHGAQQQLYDGSGVSSAGAGAGGGYGYGTAYGSVGGQTYAQQQATAAAYGGYQQGQTQQYQQYQQYQQQPQSQQQQPYLHQQQQQQQQQQQRGYNYYGGAAVAGAGAGAAVTAAAAGSMVAYGSALPAATGVSQQHYAGQYYGSVPAAAGTGTVGAGSAHGGYYDDRSSYYGGGRSGHGGPRGSGGYYEDQQYDQAGYAGRRGGQYGYGSYGSDGYHGGGGYGGDYGGRGYGGRYRGYHGGYGNSYDQPVRPFSNRTWVRDSVGRPYSRDGPPRRSQEQGVGGAYAGRGGGASGSREPDAPYDPALRIFVGGLNIHTDDTRLKQAFEAYGPVKSVRIMRHPNGVSRGFGFVTFENVDTVRKVMEKKRIDLDGFNVELRMAQPRPNDIIVHEHGGHGSESDAQGESLGTDEHPNDGDHGVGDVGNGNGEGASGGGEHRSGSPSNADASHSDAHHDQPKAEKDGGPAASGSNGQESLF